MISTYAFKSTVKIDTNCNFLKQIEVNKSNI